MLYKYATYEAILKRDGVVPDEKDRTVIRDE